MAERNQQFARILIIGNSGSGKSWLSRKLGEALEITPIDLDSVHWEPGGFEVVRDKDAARAFVREVAALETWITEGVYGWLAQELLARATALIWLDLPLDDCLDNLRSRGPSTGSEAKSFATLLVWAAAYRERQTSSSLLGHERLFTAFRGWKLRIGSRREALELLARIERR